MRNYIGAIQKIPSSEVSDLRLFSFCSSSWLTGPTDMFSNSQWTVTSKIEMSLKW